MSIMRKPTIRLISIFYDKPVFRKGAIARQTDPVGLDHYASAKPTDKPVLARDQPTVMFFGDSRALSWPIVETTDYHFINRAIGNQTSTQIVQRFDKHVAPHQPQLLLVQMCVNDLKMIPPFPDYRRDWLHLNSEGYERLNVDLKPFPEQSMQ